MSMWASIKRGASLRRLQSRSGSLRLPADRLEDLAAALELRYQEAARSLPRRLAGNVYRYGFRGNSLTSAAELEKRRTSSAGKPKLNLRGCGLTDEDVELLVAVLSSSEGRVLNKLELRGNPFTERGARLLVELLRAQWTRASSVPVERRLDEEFLGLLDLGKGLPAALRREVAELTGFLSTCNMVAAVHRRHRQLNSPSPIPLPDCRTIYEEVVGKPLKPRKLPPGTVSLSLPELVDLVLNKLSRDRAIPPLTVQMRELATSSVPEEGSSPLPEGRDTGSSSVQGEGSVVGIDGDRAESSRISDGQM